MGISNDCAIPKVHELTSDDIRVLAQKLPFPQADANKYSRGTLTLIAGSRAYPGAACLSARAAQRMGAGYVRVVVPASIRNLVLSSGPSLVVQNRKKWDPFSLEAHDPGHPGAVCIGPGFDAHDMRAEGLLRDVLEHASCPVVVDGAALSFLSSDVARALLKERFVSGRETLVTPHGGEAERMARPLALPTDDPERLAALLSLALGVVVVLKGPDTFVSDGECTFAMTEGTASLAKAGTGDVLAGMIGALLAQGQPLLQAGLLGALLHARAGKAASARFTSIGVRAEDVCECIPEAIVDLTSAQCPQTDSAAL